MKLFLQSDRSEEILDIKSLSIKQKGDALEIMEHHADIIYAVSSGVLTIDHKRQIHVQDAIIRITNGECHVVY